MQFLSFTIRFRWVVVVISVLFLVSCTDNSSENLISTQHSLAGTQVADVRVSATVESARMQTTLDYAETRVSLASTQSTFLQLTLVARGTAIESLQTEQAILQARFNTAIPLPQSSTQSTPNPNNPSQPTPILVTPLAITVAPSAPTADTTQPRLDNIVTATGVGADDCALDTVVSFSVNTPEIYVVARASNIQPNTRLSSRWLFNNEEVIVYDFTPDFFIENACIWFFIEPSDVTFQVGNWAVELAINGTAVAPPSAFTMN